MVGSCFITKVKVILQKIYYIDFQNLEISDLINPTYVLVPSDWLILFVNTIMILVSTVISQNMGITNHTQEQLFQLGPAQETILKIFNCRKH